jgi:hypothetical protein
MARMRAMLECGSGVVATVLAAGARRVADTRFWSAMQLAGGW